MDGACVRAHVQDPYSVGGVNLWGVLRQAQDRFSNLLMLILISGRKLLGV